MTRTIALLVINISFWPLMHWMIVTICLKIPSRYFTYPYKVKEKSPHQGILFYENFLKIKVWKKYLPDAAKWIAGVFPKSRLEDRSREYLERFLLETNRAEFCHWMTFFSATLSFLWNPLWADGVMVAYAALSNFPCIFTQRYNRLRLVRILYLKKVEQRS